MTASDVISEFRPDTGEHLATGWEQDTPAGDSIVHDYLTALTDRLTSTAAATGGRIRDLDDAVLVDCRSAYVFDNVAVCSGPIGSDAVRRVATAAVDFFDGVAGWALLCLDHRVDLRPCGLEVIGHPPLMYRPRGGVPPASPRGLHVAPVDSDERRRDFESVLVQAYPLPAGSAVVHPEMLRAGLRAWVGYLDGAPVATAGSHTSGAVTEIEWVSTLSSRRGNGIGSCLTWAALDADPEADAVLIATDDGQPVYRRLGFVPVIRFTMWMHA